MSGPQKAVKKVTVAPNDVREVPAEPTPSVNAEGGVIKNVGKSSGDTVTIACKMPHGMWLRVFDMVTDREPVMGGGTREFKRAQERPERVRINGNALLHGVMPEYVVASGFAFTSGVPREFWDLWLEQNKASDIVRNGLIFAANSEQGAKSMAKERVGLKSGLERLNRDNPVPKIVRQGKDEREVA